MLGFARPVRYGLAALALSVGACAGPARERPPVEALAKEAPPRKAEAPPEREAPPVEAAPAPAEPEEPKGPPVKPAGRGALTYGVPARAKDLPRVRKDSLRAGILKDVAALARKAKRPAPKADARLDAAMNDLAHNLRDDDLPALEVVDFLLTHYGITEPSPHLLLSRATAGADREIRQQASKEIAEVLKAGPVSRIGIGVDRAGDLMYVVVGLQETHLSLAPVPRQLARGVGASVEGKVVGKYRAARVVITAPDGKVAEQPLAPAGQVRGKVVCQADGKYQVEVTAEDAMGTAVLANFPVFCGMQPPAIAPRGAGTRQRGVTGEVAEREGLALVNRDRAAAGLPPVAWDDSLAAIARAHSRDMADHDFVGHVSPRTGTVVDRVHKAGVTPGLILENVGRAYSAQEAQSGFMASPGHRANVVDARAKRIGVGVVLGKPITGTIPLYVTQVLTN